MYTTPGFRDKITNFSQLHCLAFPRRDLSTKKPKQYVKIRPEILGVVLEFKYTERGLFEKGIGHCTKRSCDIVFMKMKVV